MSSLNPSVIIIAVLVGSGALVLAGAAFYYVSSNKGRGVHRDPYQRNPEQDNYMREVRQRELNKLYGGMRKAPPSTSRNRRQ